VKKKRDPARHSSREELSGILGRRRFLHLLSSGLIGRIGIPGTTAFANPSSIPLFREVAEEVGLTFHHFAGISGQYYMPEIMGAGAALFDYDNDGDLDVYLVQGTMLDPAQHPRSAKFPPPPGWKPGNRLFRNLLSETGKLEFVDVTEKAGVGHVGYGMGVAVGDYDNDGFQDLYVANFGQNILYHNNGDGTFTDVTDRAGLARPDPQYGRLWAVGAAWVDYDRDGLLDLLVVNYVQWDPKNEPVCEKGGLPDFCYPRAYAGVPNSLFHNNGDGTFTDVSAASGIRQNIGKGIRAKSLGSTSAAPWWPNQMTDTFTIVGVVGDIKESRLNNQVEPVVYLSYLQNPSRYMHLLVRTESTPTNVSNVVQREIRAVDPDLGAYDVRTMEAVLGQAVAAPKLNSLLLWVFATVALLLSAVGVYGVTSYAVAQRMQEFAIRMAMGAQSKSVFRMVTRDGLAVAIAGISVGLGGALLLGRTLASLLYGVVPTNGATLMGSAAVVLVVTLLACWHPAWRATKVDPMSVLRAE